MAISVYDNISPEIKYIFKLDTPNTSYILGIVDEEGFVGHFYYGALLNDYNLGPNFYFYDYPWLPSKMNRERCAFNDYFLMEYPTHGLGDFRESCLNIESSEGYNASGLTFESFEMLSGKPGLDGLPASFGSEEEVNTLVLHCQDKPAGLKIDLFYSVFLDEDVITRSVRITNQGNSDAYITKIYSACLDMEDRDFEIVTLHGSWGRERYKECLKVGHQKISAESIRGVSSHQDHPFMMLKTEGTNEDMGEVYAMNFVYSGNFKATVMDNQFDVTRMTMGIHPEDFRWCLKKGESFQAPEVVMVYSGEGIGKMTRTFHDFYRKHLIRSPYLHQKRPILINNWEATYFDFDTDKLISIAKEASKLGIEMLVMDDGWFGNRFDDNSSLGDWIVNEDKLKGGLKYLVDEVNKLGMKFGIWFEPEMVCPDSDLFRNHPDWAVSIPGRDPVRARNQLVLDYSRKDVRDYIFDLISKVLHSANVEYVKWDMNRALTDLGSVALSSERMGELSHRFVLGMYELQGRLIKEFPNLLLENCSSGGGRFDPGMLYFSPQIWCSDDTDAIERLTIQEGTALIYPLSTMGAHVSDCPNHMTARTTPFETRGHVALAGTFGYELDVTRISEEDRNMIPSQVEMYHKYNDLIREGDYYRIASYSENKLYDCFGAVAKDKSEALYIFVRVMSRINYKKRRIMFKGLDPEKKYRIEGEDCIYTGDVLMKAGYLVGIEQGDFKSRLIHIVEFDNEQK